MTFYEVGMMTQTSSLLVGFFFKITPKTKEATGNTDGLEGDNVLCKESGSRFQTAK